jgi:hypothetical protein
MAEPLEVNTMLADAYEPKRQNRWIFQFDDDTIPPFVARTASRPSATTEEIVIDYMNTKRYLAGKFEWNTISLGIYDPISPSSAQKVMEWVRLSYENISGRAGYAAFYKKDFTIKSLDPVGAPVEEWSIEGAWITEATFGDLDMSSAEPQQIDITLRYDRAILRF